MSGCLTVRLSGTLTEVNMPSNPKPRFPTEHDFIGRVIRDAFTWQMLEVDEVIQQRHPGVTPGQNQVMTVIDAEGTRPAELARRVGVTRQSMAETLAGMVARGFIELRPDPEDGRAKVAVLTKAGWAALHDGLDAVLAVHRHWESILGETKMTRLVKLLRELLDGLEAEAAAAPDDAAAP
jgi:DNA-binding MarR family transcriptional regulator